MRSKALLERLLRVALALATLAARFRDDRERCTDGKASFIESVVRRSRAARIAGSG